MEEREVRSGGEGGGQSTQGKHCALGRNQLAGAAVGGPPGVKGEGAGEPEALRFQEPAHCKRLEMLIKT